MKNSGFAAVGHLLAQKSPENYTQTMRHFCTVIFCNLDEDKIHKSDGFYQYDQFFRKIAVSVDSFAKFGNGVLRKRDTDAFFLQRQIELLAWDSIKYDFDRYVCSKLDRKTSLFRLFCLFNRFCDSGRIPMVLNDKSLCFLLNGMGLSIDMVPDRKNQAVTVHDFFQIVYDSSALIQLPALKKMYDELVRDVLKEGRIKYRVMEKGLVAQEKAIRTVTVTSRNLLIYDDNGDDHLEQPQLYEPKGKVLLAIPMLDIETRVLKSLFGKNVFLQLVSKSKNLPIIEMVLNKDKDSHDLYSWSQAIQEAAYSTKANTNRLEKALLRLGRSMPKANLTVEDFSVEKKLPVSFNRSLSEEQIERSLSEAALPDELPTDSMRLRANSAAVLPGSSGNMLKSRPSSEIMLKIDSVNTLKPMATSTIALNDELANIIKSKANSDIALHDEVVIPLKYRPISVAAFQRFQSEAEHSHVLHASHKNLKSKSSSELALHSELVTVLKSRANASDDSSLHKDPKGLSSSSSCSSSDCSESRDGKVLQEETWTEKRESGLVLTRTF